MLSLVLLLYFFLRECVIKLKHTEILLPNFLFLKSINE